MKKTLRIEARFGPEEVDRLRGDVSKFMSLSRVDGPLAYSIVTVVDELACNILEYAQATWLEVELRTGLGQVDLKVRDDGQPFDPIQRVRGESAMLPNENQDRKLGLYMVGKLGEDLQYQRAGSMNEFSLTVRSNETLPHSAALQIEAEKDLATGVWRFLPVGKIDVFSFPRVKQQLEKISMDEKAARVVVDLGKAEYVASSGWSVFLGRRKLMRLAGGDLAVCAMGTDLQRVYDSMKIARLLPSAPDFAGGAKLLTESKP